MIDFYREAAAGAHTRGVIVADTKFEFGWDAYGKLTLMDEVLTPDSSRFWPEASWAVGSPSPGFDKQCLRDWLTQATIDSKPWNKCPPAPPVPQEVIADVFRRYCQAFERLIGRPFEEPSS